jgi:DNA-directed RNA polymerase sigma subunit (sigma70/sigma32)
MSAISECVNYGDIKKKFIDKFTPGQLYKKSDVEKWINSNIHNAKFNSIATMWIRAYILIEIDNNSRIVKKPKSEIYKDKEREGAYKKEIVLDIDAPLNEESDTTFGDLLQLEDDTRSDLDVGESYDIFKNGLNKLLNGVKSRNRSIFLKKFGIGLPRPMLPKEIADQEGLSIARISQIFQSVIEQMQLNQIKYNIDPNILFEMAKRIR